MKNLKLLILSLFLFSCSTFRPIPQLPTYSVQERVAHPGKVSRIEIKLPEVGSDFKVLCDGKEVGHSINDGIITTYWGPKYWYFESKDGKKLDAKTRVSCFLKSKVYDHDIQYHFANFTVKPFPYKKSYIKVSKKHVDLSKEDLARYLSEVDAQKKMYEQLELNKSYTTKEFIKPLDSKITGFYGTRRVFNNKKNSWHSGTDMRARKPTAIKASNDGKVIMVKELFFNGNAVFIDHGAGIVTMYCHLSKFKVKEGQMVKRGDIIALSGNTGRSSAPHLHWGVRVQGNWVDGLQFVEEYSKEALVLNYQESAKK